MRLIMRWFKETGVGLYVKQHANSTILTNHNSYYMYSKQNHTTLSLSRINGLLQHMKGTDCSNRIKYMYTKYVSVLFSSWHRLLGVRLLV